MRLPGDAVGGTEGRRLLGLAVGGCRLLAVLGLLSVRGRVLGAAELLRWLAGLRAELRRLAWLVLLRSAELTRLVLLRSAELTRLTRLRSLTELLRLSGLAELLGLTWLSGLRELLGLTWLRSAELRWLSRLARLTELRGLALLVGLWSAELSWLRRLAELLRLSGLARLSELLRLSWLWSAELWLLSVRGRILGSTELLRGLLAVRVLWRLAVLTLLLSGLRSAELLWLAVGRLSRGCELALRWGSAELLRLLAIGVLRRLGVLALWRRAVGGNLSGRAVLGLCAIWLLGVWVLWLASAELRRLRRAWLLLPLGSGGRRAPGESGRLCLACRAGLLLRRGRGLGRDGPLRGRGLALGLGVGCGLGGLLAAVLGRHGPLGGLGPRALRGRISVRLGGSGFGRGVGHGSARYPMNARRVTPASHLSPDRGPRHHAVHLA
jgi:hypothetical protein